MIDIYRVKYNVADSAKHSNALRDGILENLDIDQKFMFIRCMNAVYKNQMEHLEDTALDRINNLRGDYDDPFEVISHKMRSLNNKLQRCSVNSVERAPSIAWALSREERLIYLDMRALRYRRKGKISKEVYINMLKRINRIRSSSGIKPIPIGPMAI